MELEVPKKNKDWEPTSRGLRSPPGSEKKRTRRASGERTKKPTIPLMSLRRVSSPYLKNDMESKIWLQWTPLKP